MNPERIDTLPYRSARLLPYLDWLLLALFLLLFWSMAINLLNERQRILHSTLLTEQQRWLAQGSRSLDDYLRLLNQELTLLTTEEQHGTAAALTQTHLLREGQLWQLDGADERTLQLRGTRGMLPTPLRARTLQLLAQSPPPGQVYLLPYGIPGSAEQNELLHLVFPFCRNGNDCQSALTGVLELPRLLDMGGDDSEVLFALTDSSGHIYAANRNRRKDHGWLGDVESLMSHQLGVDAQDIRRPLGQTPLQIQVRLLPYRSMGEFALFALRLVGGGVLLSALLVLLVWRVNQRLVDTQQQSRELLQSSRLLTLTNTSLRDRLRQLSDEQRDLQALLDTVQVGVIIVDSGDQQVLAANEAAARMTGQTRQGLMHQFVEDLFPSVGDYLALRQQLEDNLPVNDQEIQLYNGQHNLFWSQVSMCFIRYAERRALVLSFVDITERIEHARRLETEKKATEQLLEKLQLAQHELYQRATLDDLTGIANRRHFLTRATIEFTRARREEQPMAIALLDIDFFKQVNDNYGHDVGDQVLIQTVRRLDSQLEAPAMLGRLGGEEFAILLPGLVPEDALRKVDGLRNAMSGTPLQIAELTLQVTFSAGVATLAPDTADVYELIQQADKAMYRAKRAGRNRVEPA